MQGFMIYCNGTKEETMEELDQAIEKAKAEMESSMDMQNLTAEETVRLSQKLDPLIAHKQRMMIYGC